MEEQNRLISEFVNIAGVDNERAKFFLELSAWNLDMAMARFFENGDDTGGTEISAQPQPSVAPSRPAVSVSQPTARPPGKPASRFATLDSFKRDDTSSSDEEGQAFYAGGSEHGGGQQIIGPRKNADTDNLVKDMFRAAKEHGAEVVEPGGASASHTRSWAFSGKAYRLGDNDDASEVMNASAEVYEAKQVEMVLKLWRNGFSVNDGELRSYTDPQNHEFLGAIKNGDVPAELIRDAHGGEVNLNMEDHRQEDYVRPKSLLKTFSGAGHRLGSPIDTSSSTGAAAANANVGSTASEYMQAAVSDIGLDLNQPMTSVQIRLSDGSRLIAKFNHTHTVADIRRYIVIARPEFASATFVLLTTFPNRELTDETASLASGGLLNAVLVQRLK